MNAEPHMDPPKKDHCMIPNALNRRMVEDQKVSDESVEDLNALHFAMDVLVAHYKDGFFERSDEDDAEFLEVVKRLEYMMQDKWGFARRATKHTHKHRCVFSYPLDGVPPISSTHRSDEGTPAV